MVGSCGVVGAILFCGGAFCGVNKNLSPCDNKQGERDTTGSD